MKPVGSPVWVQMKGGVRGQFIVKVSPVASTAESTCSTGEKPAGVPPVRWKSYSIMLALTAMGHTTSMVMTISVGLTSLSIGMLSPENINGERGGEGPTPRA